VPRLPLREWLRRGEPWVWLHAGAVSASVLAVFGLVLLITVRGLGHFWASELVLLTVDTGGAPVEVLGELQARERVPASRAGDGAPGAADAHGTVERLLLRVGNRDLYGLDFRWVDAWRVRARKKPAGVVVIERREYGDAIGHLREVREAAVVIAAGAGAAQALAPRLERARALAREVAALERDAVRPIHRELERIRLERRGQAVRGGADARRDERRAAAPEERLLLDYEQVRAERHRLLAALARDSLVLESAEGTRLEIPLSQVLRVYRPNAMSIAERLSLYLARLWEFLSEPPREANTEGGIYPAIFGTVLLVLVMSVFVTPFGVVAAVYLREYARQGPLVRLVRIAVNNLAGVPSIVYGVFGLGFFVYGIGGTIDELFFEARLPAPTFGTGGVLWASLTLALLTLPVVIVSTEEGLARIPAAQREASMALGATQAETLRHVILPIASPAILTGLILAVARAAGEVAPLMLVGVVKLAPSLPVDGEFPYLHLERKFMHLGFHIYDVGFQSPNVEAVRPLVYATALLLVVVVVTLNLGAIVVRNRLRERFRSLEG